jgi:hypothetical protein
MSFLSAFNSQLIKFFEDLSETFPEEKEIRAALEGLQFARKSNPRLILDMFYEHIARDLRTAILEENVEKIIEFGRIKISKQFNEIMPALSIFEKHWPTLSDVNRQAIWKYLKILIALSEKARAIA